MMKKDAGKSLIDAIEEYIETRKQDGDHNEKLVLSTINLMSKESFSSYPPRNDPKLELNVQEQNIDLLIQAIKKVCMVAFSDQKTGEQCKKSLKIHIIEQKTPDDIAIYLDGVPDDFKEDFFNSLCILYSISCTKRLHEKRALHVGCHVLPESPSQETQTTQVYAPAGLVIVPALPSP